MKRRIMLLMTLSCLSSCDKKENDCQPETVLASLAMEKEITVAFDAEFERNNYSVIDGNKLVFEYNHSGAQCDHIMDDEWGEKLIFQIDNNLTQFEYMDAEILLTNCFYQPYGAWVRHDQYQVKNGSLKGEKISDNEWKISVAITTTPLTENEQPIVVELTEIFVDW